MKILLIIVSRCILNMAFIQRGHQAKVSKQLIIDTLPPIPYNTTPAPNNPVNGNGNTIPLPDTSKPQLMPDTLRRS